MSMYSIRCRDLGARFRSDTERKTSNGMKEDDNNKENNNNNNVYFGRTSI